MVEISNIYLVRHGETDMNRQGRILGNNNSSLNYVGQEQARKAQLRLEGIVLEAIYSSPQVRAIETANFLSKKVIVRKELDEINWGAFNGLTWQEVYEKFPGTMERKNELGYEFAPPGGETHLSVIQRGMNLMEELAQKHGACACVTHAIFLRLLISKILSLDFKHILSLTFDNCSVIRLSYSNGGWKIHIIS